MAKKQFKAESKRLLDIMINSIYTHKEIFLRELISNASDALDKRHYLLLTAKDKNVSKDDLKIRISIDKSNRTLTISDTGIGMNDKELEDNLGTIAKSGTLAFKLENNIKNNSIIGQFGVGFYSAFMIADKVTVISHKQEDVAYMWVSDGTDGFTITKADKEDVGTDIILHIKDSTKDDDYENFLSEYEIRSLIKKYSNFIKYPIVMAITKTKKENDKDIEYIEDETLNSMIPIWHKNKKDLTNEDYENFYAEQHFGYDKPLKTIHTKVEGTINYDALLFIPSELPFDYYSKDFDKGLELYSNNVLIMEHCQDLLPEYFSFIRGIIDSPDISLNISREVMQHDRQVQFIAKKIKDKIKQSLLEMLKEDRTNYDTFFKTFGRVIKYGVYNDWGKEKDFLKDLLLFYSSKEHKLVSLDEYVDHMLTDQKYIYYATGSDIEHIDKLPQIEFAKDKDYEILYLTEEVDEFAIKILMNYKDKEFKSVSSDDVETKDTTENSDDNKELFTFMEEVLKDKVTKVKASTRLKNHPVCITSEGDVSIEMEKVLKMMPNAEGVNAKKVLEVNTEHSMFKTLEEALTNDKDKLKILTNILYNQSLLIEGLQVEDPVSLANDIYSLIK